MTQTALTIGEAARAAGLTRKAVRVYEAKGLLTAPARTTTGYRVYDHHDVELLTFIRRARNLGLHLDDIGTIIDVRKNGDPPCGTVRDLLDARIAEFDAAVADLLALRESLVHTRRHADDCPEEQQGVVCGIIEDVGHITAVGAPLRAANARADPSPP